MRANVFDVENTQLMGLAKYENSVALKNLLRNFLYLKSLSETGDGVALVIYIDLKIAIHSEYLTELQRTCIIEHLVKRSTLKEVATDLGKSESTVAHAVTGGIKNIQKALNGGKSYE